MPNLPWPGPGRPGRWRWLPSTHLAARVVHGSRSRRCRSVHAEWIGDRHADNRLRHTPVLAQVIEVDVAVVVAVHHHHAHAGRAVDAGIGAVRADGIAQMS